MGELRKWRRVGPNERALLESIVQEELRTGRKIPVRKLLLRFPSDWTDQDVRNHRNVERKRHANRCLCGYTNAPGKTRCEDCLSKSKKVYNKRRAAGLCVGCGREVDIDGSATYCSSCIAVSRKSNKEYIKRLSKAKKPVSASPGEPVFMFQWVNTKAGRSVAEVLPKGYRVVDLFAGTGSLAVRARRKKRSVLGLNDIHPLIVNFLDVVVNGDLVSFADHADRIIQGEPQRLLALYDQAGRRQLSATEAAAVFYLVTKNVDRRDLASRTITRTRLSGLALNNRRLILEVRDLLRGTLITSLDWRDAIEVYDGPKTLFLVDPPWPGSSQMFEFNIDGRHMDLMERLASAQGEAIVMLQSSRRSMLLARHMPYTYFRQVYAGREIILSTMPLPKFGSPLDLDDFGV